MDGLQWKPLLKWMIWGYHYFWKQPYGSILFHTGWHPLILTSMGPKWCMFWKIVPGSLCPACIGWNPTSWYHESQSHLTGVDFQWKLTSFDTGVQWKTDVFLVGNAKDPLPAISQLLSWLHNLKKTSKQLPSGKRSHSWLEYPQFSIGNTSWIRV